jgi:hypothetical protein
MLCVMIAFSSMNWELCTIDEVFSTERGQFASSSGTRPVDMMRLAGPEGDWLADLRNVKSLLGVAVDARWHRSLCLDSFVLRCAPLGFDSSRLISR